MTMIGICISPCADMGGGGASEPTLEASQSFGVDIVADKLEPLIARQTFVVDIEATEGGDPDLITGAVLWLDMSDASSYTQSGGLLTAYTDKVSGEVYTEATNPPGVQGTGFNGQPCLNFDGSNDRLFGTNAAVLAAITDGASHTLYVVCHPDIVDGNRVLFGWGTATDATANSGGYGMSNTGTGRLICYKVNAAGTADNEEGSATPAELTIGDHIFCFKHDGTAHTTTGRVDDGTPNPNAGAHNWGDVDPTRFCFAANARSSPTFFGDVQLAEVRLYDSVHDADTETAIKAHLRTKWGLP